MFFLSGCPLKCLWCHNPETWSQHPVLIFDNKKCINCTLCKICPKGAHSFDTSHIIDRALCNFCGKCACICPAQALELSVRELSDAEFFEHIQKQKFFSPEGGITFSGGEPLLQGEEILKLLENTDIHTAIETSGYSNEYLFKKVVEKIDYVMFDLKLADEREHIKYTGVSNELILKNLEILRKSGKEFILRTPLIPGITDTKDNLDAIEKIVGKNARQKLPYNVLAPAKYERIGIKYML